MCIHGVAVMTYLQLKQLCLALVRRVTSPVRVGSGAAEERLLYLPWSARLVCVMKSSCARAPGVCVWGESRSLCIQTRVTCGGAPSGAARGMDASARRWAAPGCGGVRLYWCSRWRRVSACKHTHYYRRLQTDARDFPEDYRHDWPVILMSFNLMPK